MVNGTVTAVENGVGDMAIPANGFVLSGHGDARTWLLAHAAVGTSVTLGSAPPPPPPPPPPSADWVTVGSLTHEISGTDVGRAANYLVRYTPGFGASTRTNPYGFEAAVVGGKVATVADGVGDMSIPADGYVLSGHGEARSWLRANAVVGTVVTLSATEPPPTVTPGFPIWGSVRCRGASAS